MLTLVGPADLIRKAMLKSQKATGSPTCNVAAVSDNL